MFKSYHGFSLVEIMVAAAALAGLSLGVMQLSKNQKDSAIYFQTKSEEIEFANQVRLLLANKENCEETFQGLNVGGNINDIYRSNGDAAFQNGDVVYSIGQTYGERSFTLTQMAIQNIGIPAAGGLGLARLRLTLTRNKGAQAGQVYRKDISLQVRANAPNGQITECYSDVEEAVRAVCTSINGVYDAGTGNCNLNCVFANTNSAVSTQCLTDREANTYDPKYVDSAGDNMTGALSVAADVNANRFCVGGNCRNFSASNCPAGQVVRGVNADGSVSCGADADSNTNVFGKSCAAGESLRGFDASGNPICQSSGGIGPITIESECSSNCGSNSQNNRARVCINGSCSNWFIYDAP